MDTPSNNPVFTLTIGQMQSLMMEVVREALKTSESKKEETERLYSRKEACSMLKISLPTLSRYMDLGIVKGRRVGTRILILEEDLNNALHEIPTRKYNK